MKNVFFTSDTHFGHKNIIRGTSNWEDKSSCRPFDSIKKHDETLIQNWNKVVGYNSIVYHLGDLTFNYREIENTLKRLNGYIVLLPGNHDDLRKLRDLKNKCRFDICEQLKEIKIDNQKLVLCHYAMKVWNNCHRGSYHLYGHSHGSLPDDPNSLSIDVGVDCHNFSPISYEQVVEIMSKKNFKPLDHHK